MRKNIGKLPHLIKRAEEEAANVELQHHGDKKISPNNSALRNPANAGKAASMRQYAKKG